MTTVQKLLEQIQGAKKSLESHLSIPADQRNENYASARDGMVENLKGLQADFSAAQLADLPEDDHGSKAQRKAEVDNNAVNRVEMSQAKANGFDFNVKAARAGIMAGQKTIELPDVNFDAIHKMRTKAVTRTDSQILPGYEGLEMLAIKPPTTLDYLQSRPTTQNAITFRRQTTKLDDAAARAEGTSLPVTSFAASRITVPVEAIGHLFDVTVEEMEDDPGMQMLLAQAAQDVWRELNEQVVIGSGTAPALTGIVNSSGIQTEAYATSRAMSIKNGITSLKTTERATPGLLLMDPADFDLVIGDLIASPSFAINYIQNGIQARLWGLPVVEEEDIVAGYAYVYDPSLAYVAYRTGMVLEQTQSDGSKFAELVATYRAYIRAAYVMRRLNVRKVDITA